MTASQPFEGFRAGQRATTIPVQFFTELLAQIDDPDELRVTLYALYAIPRPGRPHAIRVSELASEYPMRLMYDAPQTYERVRRAVEAASDHGVLLTLPLDDRDLLVFVNNESGRRLRERVATGVEVVGGARPASRVTAVAPGQIQTVYEAEIGTLTSSVSLRLTEAEQMYSVEWIVDALREAARQNKRSWAYAEAILRRWQAEGRRDEAATGHSGRGPDPYEHLYRRD